MAATCIVELWPSWTMPTLSGKASSGTNDHPAEASTAEDTSGCFSGKCDGALALSSIQPLQHASQTKPPSSPAHPVPKRSQTEQWSSMPSAGGGGTIGGSE